MSPYIFVTSPVRTVLPNDLVFAVRNKIEAPGVMFPVGIDRVRLR